MTPQSQRKPNRLKGYDYNQPGYYFVTLCTKSRVYYFGDMVDNKIQYSWYGNIALRHWQRIPQYYQNVDIDEFVIMPNHIHGIIIINPSPKTITRTESVGTEHCSVPTSGSSIKNYGLLSKVIKSFKNTVTRQIRLQFEDDEFAWQRSFYDHIIRNEKSLTGIRKYIKNNPTQWELDKENPENLYM